MRTPINRIKAATLSIRKAFGGVYSDIDALKDEIEKLKKELAKLKKTNKEKGAE